MGRFLEGISQNRGVSQLIDREFRHGLLKGCQPVDKRFEDTIQQPVTVKRCKIIYRCGLGHRLYCPAVVDEKGQPVTGAMRYAEVVKDGLVVDYVGASRIVKELKAEVEEKLGMELETAAAAYPPGTEGGDRKAIQYVAEGAGFDVIALIDEPPAANQVLGIVNGLWWILGGTTGVAILKEGEVVYIADEPTGGTHFSLVVRGYGIPLKKQKIKDQSCKAERTVPGIKAGYGKGSVNCGRHIQKFHVDNLFLPGAVFPE